jgi:hypothetical protein
MSKKYEVMGLVCATALSLPTIAHAGDAFTEALSGGKTSGEVRVRYETVSDDAVAKDADALTVRTRLAYETAPFMGFTAAAEFEDVRTLFGVDNYAPETVNVPPYATILDRSVTELNRALIRYRGLPKLDLAYGRQRLNYDNQRFIGSVGWRQDDQTFDGFTAAYTGLADFAFNYAYLTGVNGVDQTLDSSNISDNLFNVSYSGFTWGKFTGYAYLLDHKDETNAAVNAGLRFKSNDTYGLRFDGSYALPITKSVKLLYTAEYASQDFESTAGVKRDADYKFAEVGVVYGLPSVALTAKYAFEELGTDGGLYGFQTPFATKHAFNGWADKFLVTPAAGLQDKFVTVAANLLPYKINLMAVYHTYDAVKGSGDFGSEWDLQATKAFGPHYTLGIKYSAYSGQELPYRDTDKLWVWGEFKF